MRKILWLAVALWLFGCCPERNWRHTAPWNFPSAAEWNRPLELSFENAVDKFREVTAPKGKVYDPLTRSYAPDFGAALRELSKECEDPLLPTTETRR